MKARAQTFVVERRPVALGPQPTLSLTDLPVPPAGRERYRAWRSAAGWQVRLQNPRRVRGPVAISITLEEGARVDLDNLTRAPIDLLCELNLIEGDRRDVIREVNLRWGAEPGLRIDVRPVA